MEESLLATDQAVIDSRIKGLRGAEEKENFLLARRPFDLDLEGSRDALSPDAPLSEDIDFDYIHLDLETLNGLKSANFWSYLLDNTEPQVRFGETLNIDQMMSLTEKFEQPMLKIKDENIFIVEKIFVWMKKVCDPSTDQSRKGPENKIRKIINIAQDKGPQIIKELYLLVIKFLRNSEPGKEEYKRMERVWHLMSCVCSCVLPPPDFIYPIFNYLVSVINNNPNERYKEWSRFCLKRLFMLKKNQIKRMYAPCSKEIDALRSRKKYAVSVYLQNGFAHQMFVENYSTIEEVRQNVLKATGLPPAVWPHFGILESISRPKQLEERMLKDSMMVTDVESSWELVGKGEMKTSRLYLALKFNPKDTNSLLQLVYFSKVYDLYFGKVQVEFADVHRYFALSFQVDYGDYSDKPGFVKMKIKNYHHPYFAKYYSDESFIQSVISRYRELKGKGRDEAMVEYLTKESTNLLEIGQLFTARFKNSNSSEYKELQQNLILGINSERLTFYEEVSREKVFELRIEDISSWGLNQDVFVLCFNDRIEITKFYFETSTAHEIGECFELYTKLKVEDSYNDTALEKLENLSTVARARRANIFVFH